MLSHDSASSSRPSSSSVPHAAQVIPVAGDRARARGARLLLHDQAALDAGFQPGELAGFDACRQAHELAEGDVERFLGPFGAGAGIAHHRAAVAQGVGRGVDGVAQAALLADFGEQPRAHAAAQHADGAPGLKVVGIAVRQALVSDADLRLVRLVVEMRPLGKRFAGRRLRERVGRPIGQQRADVVLEALPIEMAGHAQDRALRLVVAREVVANLADADCLERGGLAVAGAAERVGIVMVPQLEHHLLARLVLDGAQLLQRDGAGRLELVVGKQGAPQQVGEQLEPGEQVAGQRGAAVAGVAVGDRFAPLDAQVFQGLDELALSRWPAPRVLISQVSVARPSRAGGSYTAPAGTRKLNAADSSDIIGSATSARPLS